MTLFTQFNAPALARAGRALLAGALCVSGFAFCAFGKVRPVSNILYTPESIDAMHAAIREHDVLRNVVRHLMGEADYWMGFSEERLRALMPGADAVFAMGSAGDPETNGFWARHGMSGLCSLEKPFEIKSPYTGKVYGTQKEGERFYDPGSGWVRPEDGRVFYFRGIWNSYVVQRLHRAVDRLSMGYLLTSDEAYAQRALFILDLLADLRSKRPAVDGTLDWPIPLTANSALFSWHGNQANERIYNSALAMDLIGGAAYAQQPSPTNPSLSVFENIRRNYFTLFDADKLHRRDSLHNHSLSTYSAMIALGLLFGNPEYVRQGIDACYGFLDNAIDRDGEYYEVSAAYQNVGRVYAARMLALLGNYDPARYADPQAFPQRQDYPYELNFGNHPVWQKSAVSSQFRVTVLSRSTQYGNSSPDRFTPEKTATTEPYNPARRGDSLLRMMFLKLFHFQSTRPEWRELAATLFWNLPEGVRENHWTIADAVISFGPGQWLIPPRADSAQVPQMSQIPQQLDESQPLLLGHKRIAILRSGQQGAQRALFMRGGASNSHAHDDQMALTLYDRGMSLTGEYGYRFWGTPDNRGYGTRAIAHKTVVVDEDYPGGPIFPSRPAASIEGWLPQAATGMVEMSNPSQWPDTSLEQYRRQVWMIAAPQGGDGYFMDMFWVRGGRTHDYAWQAPYADPPQPQGFSLGGVSPQPHDGVWTLAGLNPQWRDADFNRKGQSWGERLEVGSGTIRNIGIAGEKLASHDWNPAPGNGYGFVWDVRLADAAAGSDWSATWLLHDLKTRTRLTMLNPDGQSVITGKTPTLSAGRSQDIVVARRSARGAEPLQSRFVSIAEVDNAAGQWPVQSARWLGFATAGGGVAVSVDLAGGYRDTLLALPGEEPLPPQGFGDADTRLWGRRGFVRRDAQGAPVRLVLSAGTELEASGVSLKLEVASLEATVTAVEPSTIEVDATLPTGGQLAGSGAFFSSPPGRPLPYASNEFFTVEAVRNLEGGRSLLAFDYQSTTSARLRIESIDDRGLVTTWWPNAVANVMEPGRNGAKVFEGHALVAEDAGSPGATVTAYRTAKTLEVDAPQALVPGAFYRLLAVRPGDRMRIDAQASLENIAEGEWQLVSNVAARVRLPGNPSGRWFVRCGGEAPRVLEAGAGGFLDIPLSANRSGTVSIAAAGAVQP